MLNQIFPQKSWTLQAKQQLQSFTKSKYIDLLRKDPNWELEQIKGARHCFINPKLPKNYNRVVIHYHPKQRFYEWKLLRSILDQICWTEEELKKKKIIK